MTETVVCPYCRSPFDESGPPKIFCVACGVPHHEDCYEENGGCTVFGCARAPADDPKLQVSQSDLNAFAATVGQAASPVQTQQAAPITSSIYSGPLGLSQPSSAPVDPGRPRKSRTMYIVLGIFLGPLGIHNFYAGYTGRAIGQLCLSVLTLFYLAVVSWIWAIVEICVVDKDNAGIQFG